MRGAGEKAALASGLRPSPDATPSVRVASGFSSVKGLTKQSYLNPGVRFHIFPQEVQEEGLRDTHTHRHRRKGSVSTNPCARGRGGKVGCPDGGQSRRDDPHCCSHTLGVRGRPVTLVLST